MAPRRPLIDCLVFFAPSINVWYYGDGVQGHIVVASSFEDSESTSTLTCWYRSLHRVNVLAKLSILVRSFIYKNITRVHSHHSPPRLLSLTWNAIPRSQGGLSLLSQVDTLRSYRLSVVISGLVAIHSTPLSASHWFTSALCLFTLSLRHLGLGLDILYLPQVP